MPKIKTARVATNGNGLRVSYAGIGAIVAVLSVIGILWKAGSEIATRADIASLQSAITPQLSQHEERIRQLELANASHFGSSPAAIRPGSDDFGMPLHDAAMILAQAQYSRVPQFPVQAQIPAEAREIPRPMIPLSVIQAYRLSPTIGGTYAMLGEDGKYYSIDGVVISIALAHLDEMRQRK